MADEIAVQGSAQNPTIQLFVIRQLPIIEENLRSVKERTLQKVEEAKAMVCCEETLRFVEAARAENRKELKEYEDQRKWFKETILTPYNELLAVYKDCVYGPMMEADAIYLQKATAVKSGMKEICEIGLREYFAEQCQVYNVDFLRYEQAGVKVDMAAARAETPTKQRSQIDMFVMGVASDIRMISKMDLSEEIMVEYKRTLSVAKAVTEVQDRHRQIEVEKAAAEQRQTAEAQEKKAVERVQSFAPPVVEEKPEILRLVFTVEDTKPRLWLLKQFLDANGYNYT